MTPDTGNLTPDTWHLPPDTWHLTPDTWHLTCDTWWGVNILSKFQLPSSFDLGGKVIWRSGGKGSLTYSLDQSVMKLFIEQPRLHRVWEKSCIREFLSFWVSKFLSYQVYEFPSFRVTEFPSFQVSKGGREGGRTNERSGTDHGTSGPMRGLKKCSSLF